MTPLLYKSVPGIPLPGWLLTIVLISIVLATSCKVTPEEFEEAEILYYTCTGNIIIRAEQNTNENCLISIYQGKELITGRQLLRKDTAGWNYVGGDIAASIGDSIAIVEFRGQTYEGCTVSAIEKQRREYRDTVYYITNTGALIKLSQLGDSVNVSMAYGSMEVFDGALPRVRSGSGEKYESGNTMFWSKGNTAMFIHDGINYSHCIRMWQDEILYDPCTDNQLDGFVNAFLQREYSDEYSSIPEEQRRYYAEYYDLNNDGLDEVFIALRSPYFCGTGGCTWHIASPDTTALARITVSQFPVYISANETEAYKDLYVASRDKYHTLVFDGESYPSNPTMEEEIRLFTDPAYTNAGTVRVLSLAYLKSCPF